MLLATVLVRANHASFENRKEAFQRVCMDLAFGFALADVFLVVIYGLMDADQAGIGIEARAIGVQDRSGMHVGAENVFNLQFRAILDALREHVSAALDKADNLHLVGKAASLYALRLAVRFSNVRFICLNDFALTAKWASIRARWLHALADTMRHEPSGLIGDAQHAA